MEEKRAYQKRDHCKVYENIKAICKYRDIRIQDVEKEIFRNQGYLSRGNITAEELLKISQILDVSMDSLMTKDYDREISVMNILMLVRINVKTLKDFLAKDECMKELIKVLNEVYGE